MNSIDLAIAAMGGQPAEPESRTNRPNPLWNSYRCKDGRWIYLVLIQPDRFWRAFCGALDRGEWIEDARFSTTEMRTRNNRELIRLIEDTLATRTLDEWAPRFDEKDLVWAPVQTNAEVLRDPQADALGIFHPLEHPALPDCRVVRGPIEFSGYPDEPFKAAPELGRDTERVALECGLSAVEIERLRQAGVINR
jgi:crotonobetainyl-CoA:carnitine CoA-transferase CaiB-like acyl-CoA transferase